MDQWRRKPLREERSNKNPSFSSTLLDTIYRSIEEEEDMVMYRGETTSKKKQSHSFEEEEVENLKRIENWMEKKVTSDKTEEVPVFFNQKQQLGTLKFHVDDCYKMAEDYEIDNLVFHSNSSSSDSSFYGFSSSEMESWPSASYRSRRSEKVSRSDDYNSSRKTGNMIYDRDKRGSDTTTTAAASKNSKLSSGSRALKMYRDLKMKNSSNKPPISPGRRIATFLNSIFTSSRGGGNENGNGNGNNVVKKKVSPQSQASSTATTTTPCSTASSFSRSCLSKTPNSSAGKKIRSVRFYPVSVIVDEDSRPCGHKSLDPDYKVMTTDQQQLLRFHLMEKNRKIEEAAKDLLLFRNYEKKKTSHHHHHRHHHHRLGIRESDDEDDYDSGSSDSSSDLFELDHLSAGMERRRYREELPVYETTHLRAISNRPIANGYLL